MSNTIPTQAEYEARERADLWATLRNVEQAPLADRQEARTSWTEALIDNTDHAGEARNLVAERVGWLLNGSYGKGSHMAAWQILGETRRNRVAALSLLIAALEWRCPGGFASEAWRKLASAQQEAVNAAIQAEIDYALAQRNEHGRAVSSTPGSRELVTAVAQREASV